MKWRYAPIAMVQSVSDAEWRAGEGRKIVKGCCLCKEYFDPEMEELREKLEQRTAL